MGHGIKTSRLAAAYSLVRGQKNSISIGCQLWSKRCKGLKSNTKEHIGSGPDFLVRINVFIHYSGFQQQVLNERIISWKNSEFVFDPLCDGTGLASQQLVATRGAKCRARSQTWNIRRFLERIETSLGKPNEFPIFQTQAINIRRTIYLSEINSNQLFEFKWRWSLSNERNFTNKCIRN